VERSESSVSDDDELAHESGDGEEWFFAVLGEFEEEGSELRVVSGGGESGHEEKGFDFGPPAFGAAIGIGVSALPWVRREAGESGGLSSVERAEFGHESDESGGGFGTDAWDAGEDGGGAFEGL
jgi:hypothetical protein